MIKESDNKKDLARILYMSGTGQDEIADKIGVTRQTISRWATQGAWKEQRAAKNTTRPELVNKLLLSIDKLIEEVNKSDDVAAIGGMADKLAKFAAAIEKLDKKANIVDTVEVFIAFSKYVEFRSKTDPSITPEFMSTLNALQDAYVVGQANRR